MNQSPYIVLVLIYVIGLTVVLLSNVAAIVAKAIIHRKMRKHAKS